MTDMQTHPLRTSDSTEEVTLAHTGLKSNAEQRVSKIAWAGQGQQSPPSADGSALAPENGLAAKSDDDKSKPRGERLMAGLVRGMHNLGNAVHDVGHSVKEQTRAMGDLLKLSKQVSEDLKNTTLYPELEHDAHLRRNNNLSKEEEAFVTARKAYIAKSGILKRFLQLPEDEEVHEDDVPQIALGGSGGGYRACLGFMSVIEQMQEHDTGLWDLIMYVAGVSGSCWSIAS
jgi:cytosolic phospholipase A2